MVAIGPRADVAPAPAADGRAVDGALAPSLVEQNFEIIKQVNETGVAMLMVEQNANMALSIADRGYVLATGELVLADTAENLLASEDLKRAYLGR